ncbi:MAG TPA: ribonuclease P protein component [Trueperaceae bacterium]
MPEKDPGVHSLKGDAAFRRLRRGRPGGDRLLSVRWLANNDEVVRVGIVVSKKVGKAVVRNRVRRRLREALRAILATARPTESSSSSNPLSPKAMHRGRPSFDLIVIARPEAAQADYWTLRASLAKALARGHLFE